MGATAAIAAVSIGTAVYAASQQPKAPKLPAAPVMPVLPTHPTLAASTEQGDLMARSAGGTIKSKDTQQIGDATNATRKTLLGA